MLRWRLLLGAVLIAALVALFWIDLHTSPPAAWLFFLALGAGAAAAQETVSLFAAAGHRPSAGAIYGGTMAVLASNAIPLFLWPAPEEQALARLGWPLAAFVLSLLAVLIVEMWHYRQPGGSMVRAALATFTIAYVGLLLSFAVQLRVLGGAADGMVRLIALIVVVKMGDTGAYTAGRLFGRHKMAPLISPGKTLEGAAGALLFACFGAWFSFTYLADWIGDTRSYAMLAWIPFGLIVGGAGLLGDLAESLFKRDMGVKDSSTWLPGFGGVLDLLDSILFAAPVTYLCWLAAAAVQ